MSAATQHYAMIDGAPPEMSEMNGPPHRHICRAQCTIWRSALSQSSTHCLGRVIAVVVCQLRRTKASDNSTKAADRSHHPAGTFPPSKFATFLSLVGVFAIEPTVSAIRYAVDDDEADCK